MANYPMMSQAEFLGQGFDIFGTFDVTKGVIKPLFDPTKAQVVDVNFLKTEYSIPSYLNLAEDTQGYTDSGVYKTREEIQKQLAIKVGIKAGYMGLFSAEVKAAYNQFNDNTHEWDYAYINQFNQLGVVSIQADPSFLDNEFSNRINLLPNSFDPNNPSAFFDFFDTYGAFYISKVTLGSSSQFYIAVNKSSQLSTQSISESMHASYHGLIASGSISESVKQSSAFQAFASNSNLNLLYFGGDPALAEIFANLAENEFPANPSSDCVTAYNNWVMSEDTDAAVIDFQVTGIWDLCGNKGDAVHMAWESYYRVKRPKLVIGSTGSIEIPAPWNKPTITLDQTDLSLNTQPAYNRGIQAVVLNGSSSDITNPNAVKLNKYYSYGPWDINDNPPSFITMFNQVGNDLSNLVAGDIVIFTTFNMESFVNGGGSFSYLLNAIGSGPGDPMASSDPACSTGGEAVFIMVGKFQAKPGVAIGYYFKDNSPVEGTSALLEVLLYPNDRDGGYSLGDGNMLKAPSGGSTYSWEWKEM